LVESPLVKLPSPHVLHAVFDVPEEYLLPVPHETQPPDDDVYVPSSQAAWDLDPLQVDPLGHVSQAVFVEAEPLV
jgi:hypothetical protein